MERYKVPFHVYETEWTFEQFCYLIQGIKANNEAQKAAMDDARGERDYHTPHSRHDAQEFDTLKQYIPDTARNEAQYKA
jgi:hypothetical protein